ncbi:MAG: S1/P1 nuclease [Muribaculaceae bacterium]|nr:S1/P1 nuclease [Muribaculaceae bacterium]
MKKIAFILCLMVAQGAMAWNIVGHRIVADVAYHNLTPKARAAVDSVLGFERAIVALSSWADDIKSDTIYEGQSQWHFQDLDAGKTDKDLEYLYNNKLAEGYHLFQAKDSIINLLKRNPGNADALKFLIHLTGDEYQPMHMGHLDDLGGNKARFMWFGRSISLHSLWDGTLIDYSHYSSTEYCDYLLQRFASQRDEIYGWDELTCIKKTYQVVNSIYTAYSQLCASSKGEEKGAKKFYNGFEYRFAYRYRPMLDMQLYMGGLQLAKELNEIYK